MENHYTMAPQTKVPLRIAKLLFLLLSSICLFGQSSIDKGKALYESKKYQEAEKVFKAVPEKAGDYAAAQYYLGRIAFDKKVYDDAADYFKEATECNPKEGDYFNWLGDAYATIGKDANIFKQMSVGPKALRAWEKATELDAKNINARVSLVGAYLQAPAFMGGGVNKANEEIITDKMKYIVVFASGNGGQYIMIIKDLNLVIAFTGNSYDSWKSKRPFELLIKYVLPYFDLGKRQ